MEEEHYIAKFIKYNNAVPIILGLLFLGGGGAFAATNPDVQASVYSATTEVRSIDNTYIASVDVESYPFSIHITGVTEDDEYYYLTYTLDTIDIVDYVWQDTQRGETLRVNKTLLGTGDLQAYAESELAQVRDHEKQRLAETQVYERKLGVTQKVVATAYSGLVGKFVNATSETAPVYIPPPGKQNKNDPLAISNPTPLTTWDANAEVIVYTNPSNPGAVSSTGPSPSNPNHIILSTTEVTHSTSTVTVGTSTATSTPPVTPPATTTSPVTPPATTTPPVTPPPPAPEPTPEPPPESPPPPEPTPTP